MNVNSVDALSLSGALGETVHKFKPEEQEKFADFLSASIDAVENSMKAQDYSKNLLLAGDENNLHDVTIASTESQLTLNLAIAVRNKVVDAYTEVMRMNV